MIDPEEIVVNLVTLLRDIPALVAAMNGEADRIFSYRDEYPTSVSLALAVHEMPHPSTMAAWQRTSLGTLGNTIIWAHHISVYVRAGDTPVDDTHPPLSYPGLLRLIARGVPVTLGDGQPMLYTTVHPSCQPMELLDFGRQTAPEGLDYFELTLSFAEIGDE